MILLLDIGNTNTHVGLANRRRVVKRADLATSSWATGRARTALSGFVGKREVEGVVVCSVVPPATVTARQCVQRLWSVRWIELRPATLRGLALDYPRPESIGPDRLANALAARVRYGAPCVAVDFGTAVTFDVVDRAGNFVGGVIAPGLGLMTRYLREKTALLPEIEIQPIETAIGKSTEDAMRIGAVHGFRGLVRDILGGIKRSLRCGRLPVVATGGYADMVAQEVPEIQSVDPLLTLEGLRLTWEFEQESCRFPDLMPAQRRHVPRERAERTSGGASTG